MEMPTAAKGSRNGASSSQSAASSQGRNGVAAKGTSDASAMRDSRIQHGIEKVGDEVHGHEHDGDQEEGALRYRIVAGGHRVDQKFAKAGPAEDRLDHHIAANGGSEAKRKGRRHRQQGVTCPVPHDD